MVSGSLEVLVGAGANPDSRGMTVKRATDSAVPVVVEAVYGITGLAPVDPPREGAVAEWRAVTALGESVAVVLWREVAFDPALIGATA